MNLISIPKIVLGIIIYIILGELLKDLLLFPLVEPLLNHWFAPDTAEHFSEICEYLMLAALLIPIALYFVVYPVNAANRSLLNSNQEITAKNEKLDRQKKCLDDMFRHQSAVMLIIDQTQGGKIIDANDSALAFYGYDYDEIINLNIADINILPDEAVRERMMEAIQKKQSRFIFSHRLKNGAIREVEVHSTPMALGNKRILFSIIFDITEKFGDFEALRETEEKFKALFNQSVVGIYVHDIEGQIMDVNQTACLQVGYSRDELRRMTVFDLHPDDKDSLNLPKDKILREWQKWLPEQSFVFEVQHQRKDGVVIPIQLSTCVISYASQKLILAISQNITERKQAEMEIRKSEKRFRDLCEMLPEAVFEADLEMNLNFMNQQAFIMFGYSQQDFGEGLKLYDMLATQERERARTHGKQQLEGAQYGATEYRALKKDGTLFPVLLHTNPVIENNSISGFRGIIIDITERKLMEEHLIDIQKMESIGNLAGGIAHDFNNILFPIVGVSELLMEDLPENSLEYENARHILKAGKRGTELVKQILAFSRQTEHRKRPVRLQQILKEVLQLVRSTIPSNIRVHRDLQNDCAPINADPTQIHQVVMNLITNAFHAINERIDGEIAVKLGERNLSNEDFSDKTPRPGRYAMVSVSDNGVGIEPKALEKIFEPYFTTKKKGKGTGLGLAVVYGIIKEHGGHVKVDSEVGKGSRFRVYLPLCENEREQNAGPPDTPPETGNERILLVDDEESVVLLEKQMLTRLGYQVTDFTSSSEAFQAFKANPDAFDLVISDMAMPNMTGDQLAREITAIRPDMPVIVCSGYSDRMNGDKADALGVKAFLMKPIVKSNLAQTVRRVLNGN